MLGKLCVCGHEMKPQGKQTLEIERLEPRLESLDRSCRGGYVHLLVVRPHGIL